MAYYATDHIKGYRNYEDWAAHEASVKPIRGRDVKPLARRKDWYMCISRDGDDIVLRESYNWENAARVVYCKNGTLKLLAPSGGLYNSGQRFILATTGIRIYTRGRREWIDMGRDSSPVLLDTSKGVVTFKRNPENTKWVPAKKGSTGTHYVLNRKAFNAVKKRLRPYMTQLEIFLKLKADDITLQRQRWYSNVSDIPPTLTVKAVAVPTKPSVIGRIDLELCKRCMESSDVEDWYEAHQQFLRYGPHYFSHYHVVPWYLKLPENVISYAWEQVKYIFRDEIFEEKPNSKPSHMSDPNNKYFR